MEITNTRVIDHGPGHNFVTLKSETDLERAARKAVHERH